MKMWSSGVFATILRARKRAMIGSEHVHDRRRRMRASMPLCFAASFALHACLMAMSSLWMSGGAVTAVHADDELETYTIYLSIPRSTGGDGRAASGADGGEPSSTAEDRSARTELARDGDVASSTLGAASLSAASATTAQPSTPIVASTIEATPTVSAPVPTAQTATTSDSAAEYPPRATAPNPLVAATVAPITPVPIAIAATAKPSVEAPQSVSATSTPIDALPVPVAPVAATSSASDLASATKLASSNVPSPTLAASDVAKPVAANGAAALGASGANDGEMRGGASTSDSGRRGNANKTGDGDGRGGAHESTDGEGRGSAIGDGSGAPGAVLTYDPRPEYPAESVRSGEDGHVLCSLHIDARGSVTRVELLRSSGHPRLDAAAVEALSRWKFLPARKDGHAVACRVPHWVTFRLE
jgi:protein TonB